MYGLKYSLKPLIAGAEKQQSADENPALIAEGLIEGSGSRAPARLREAPAACSPRGEGQTLWPISGVGIRPGLAVTAMKAVSVTERARLRCLGLPSVLTASLA